MLESNTDKKLHTEEAHADFVERYPSFLETLLLDNLRTTEYRRRRQVYLDYTGGSLYAESQLQKHLDLLRSGDLVSARYRFGWERIPPSPP